MVYYYRIIETQSAGSTVLSFVYSSAQRRGMRLIDTLSCVYFNDTQLFMLLFLTYVIAILYNTQINNWT